MRDHYNLEEYELRRNPWPERAKAIAAKKQAEKKQINIRVEQSVLTYFEEIAEESSITLHEALRQGLREVQRQGLRPRWVADNTEV